MSDKVKEAQNPSKGFMLIDFSDKKKTQEGNLSEYKKDKKEGKRTSSKGIHVVKMSKGGRAGFKVGGAAKRGISKILRKK